MVLVRLNKDVTRGIKADMGSEREWEKQSKSIVGVVQWSPMWLAVCSDRR